MESLHPWISCIDYTGALWPSVSKRNALPWPNYPVGCRPILLQFARLASSSIPSSSGQGFDLVRIPSPDRKAHQVIGSDIYNHTDSDGVEQCVFMC